MVYETLVKKVDSMVANVLGLRPEISEKYVYLIYQFCFVPVESLTSLKSVCNLIYQFIFVTACPYCCIFTRWFCFHQVS